MTDRMHEAAWREWVADACAVLEVDPAEVDITEILALTKQVAHNLDRPLAPVSSYILGVAVGAAAAKGEQADHAALLDRLLSTVPQTPETS